jgi:nucleotide-binding universal stress UspA family protein
MNGDKEDTMQEIIVVPLDGSKVGESALPYVEDLVSKLSPEVKVEVVLLQVLSPMRPTVPTEGGVVPAEIDYTEQQKEENKKRALDYLNEVGEAFRSKGVTVTAKVVTGDHSEEIVKAAEEVDANLIAMSTHGRSGLSRWAFGSVTDKVLRREGKIPIIMVRAPKKD